MPSCVRRKLSTPAADEEGIFAAFGSAVLELLAAHDVLVPVKIIGVPDIFVAHGAVPILKELYGHSVAHIKDEAHTLVKTSARQGGATHRSKKNGYRQAKQCC